MDGFNHYHQYRRDEMTTTINFDVSTLTGTGFEIATKCVRTMRLLDDAVKTIDEEIARLEVESDRTNSPGVKTQLTNAYNRKQENKCLAADLLKWVKANAESLNLTVDVGSVRVVDIYNNISTKTKYERLSADTFPQAIERQRQFLDRSK